MKLVNSIILLAVVAIFFLLACKKENNNLRNAAVEGYVLDYASTDSVASCTVELWEAKTPRSNRIEDFDRMIATSTTDSNGYFKIEFQRTPTYLYGLRPRKKGYYERVDVGSFSATKEATHMNIGISPMSWTKLEIKNLPPSLPTDTFNFDDVFILTGENIDTAFYIPYAKVFTSSLYFYDIVTQDKNERNFFSPSVCPAFDTCVMKIEF